jgi:hypothetical protein
VQQQQCGQHLQQQLLQSHGRCLPLVASQGQPSQGRAAAAALVVQQQLERQLGQQQAVQLPGQLVVLQQGLLRKCWAARSWLGHC